MTSKGQPDQRCIRSEILGNLRKLEGLKGVLGPLAQFVVVVDANVILKDLIWLVGKRRNPEAMTALMECVKAGTIVAYVTRSVLAEVDEHITTIAAARNLSEEALRAEWKSYRKLVKVKTPRKALVARYQNGQDPDDAPTIALQKMLRADGILSKDSDLVAMGGLVIELDFTNQAREYSRKTAVAATIRVSGGMVLIVSWGVIAVALKSMTAIAESFRRLPPAAQVFVFIAVLAIGSNRRARERATTMIRQANASIRNHWPAVAGILAEIAATLAENTVSPPSPNIRVAKTRTIHNERPT